MREKSKKDIFSDATQLDESLAVTMLSETTAYKSQCIFKYLFLWKFLSFEGEFSNPV